MASVDVSIIIVTYNSSSTIKQCLQSLFEFHGSVNFEILISDNDSKDDTLSIVQSLGKNIKIVNNGQNLGFGAANNRAARQAQGKFLYFVNPDLYFTEPVLEKFTRFMSETPKASACSGVLYENDKKTLSTTIGSFPGPHSIVEDLGFHFFRRKIFKNRLSKSRAPFSADYISGASIFMKKALFDEIGGFDEKFFLYYEETDLFYRLSKKGYRPYILPDVKLIHIGGFSTGKTTFNPSLFKVYLESRYYFFEKHFSKTVVSLIRFTDQSRKLLKIISGRA